MLFKGNISENKAYQIARESVTVLGSADVARKYIKELGHCAPHKRSPLIDCNDDIAREVIDLFIYALFNTWFVYWPEQRLLGCCGKFPDEFKRYFEAEVYFQNSCYQDYPYSDWKGISLFDQVTKAIGKMDTEKLLTSIDYISSDDLITDEQYWRRTLIYTTIYKMLDLDNWLYGKDSGRFFRFAMSPMVSSEKRLELETIAQIVFRKHRGQL